MSFNGTNELMADKNPDVQTPPAPAQTESVAVSEDAKGKQFECLLSALLTESKLDELDIPPLEKWLGDWLCAGDLGYIFAPRGVGKTWLSLKIATSLAAGKTCGEWQAGRALRVLYIDGEMPLDSMRKRIQSLRETRTDNLTLLSHQQLFDKGGKALCLSDLVTQASITKICEEQNIDVVFLDNLSTLFTGVRENDADDWRDMAENWLLDLRRLGIGVVVIAHAGRNGYMRGTSKREDTASWIISLTADEAARDESKFTAQFTKCRHCSPPQPMLWTFKHDNGKTTATCATVDQMAIFLSWIDSGLTGASDIAEEMGISKGRVSQLATKAIAESWIVKNGRG